MNRLLIIAVLIACLLSCKNKGLSTNAIIQKDTLRILTYGLTSVPGKRASSFIAKKYGFHYYPVTGCPITKELMDSVGRENGKVYTILEQQYGNDWKKNFDKSVDSLSLLENHAEALVNSQSFIQQMNKRLKGKGNLYYYIAPADSGDIFLVKAYGFDTSKQHTEDIMYYTMKVNLKSNKVVLED